MKTSSIVLINLLIIGSLLLWLYFDFYFNKIKQAKINELTLPPCEVKHPYGSWGEECKQYILNKLEELESK
jgi:hypothetical protein